MNSQENQNLNRRLQKLKSQINQSLQVNSQPGEPLQPKGDRSQNIQFLFNQLANWFNKLSANGKIVVIAVAAVVGLALLRTVLQLVASLVSLAVLGVVVYLVYKFWIAPQPPK